MDISTQKCTCVFTGCILLLLYGYRQHLFQPQSTHTQTYSHNLKTPPGQMVVINVGYVLKPAGPTLKSAGMSSLSSRVTALKLNCPISAHLDQHIGKIVTVDVISEQIVYEDGNFLTKSL